MSEKTDVLSALSFLTRFSGEREDVRIRMTSLVQEALDHQSRGRWMSLGVSMLEHRVSLLRAMLSHAAQLEALALERGQKRLAAQVTGEVTSVLQFELDCEMELQRMMGTGADDDADILMQKRAAKTLLWQGDDTDRF